MIEWNYETLTTCLILFNRFMQKWNLTLSQMGNLVGTYTLASFISKNEDDLNEFGLDGAIEVMEHYILAQGGILARGTVS